MKNGELTVKAEELRNWLEEKKEVIVLDVRPKSQREEWQIPGSIYVDAYQRLNANDPSVLDDITIPENSKVITVCEAGRTSQIAANELRGKGINAYSLDGGMKAWSTAWNKAKLDLEKDIQIIQVRRTGKGCLSYIISSKGLSLIIDPSLPVEVYEKIVKEKGLQLKYILETHTHADHLSRAKSLAEKYGLKLFLQAESKVHFPFSSIRNGDLIKLNDINVEAISTPGHTLDSLCFLINEKALITGDTLFINGVGRPDLKADEDGTEEKAKLLFQSLHKLLALKDTIIVLPGHTSQPVAFDNEVIQTSLEIIRQNTGILQLAEDEFINTLIQRIPQTPANYLSIVEKNIKGDFTEINAIDLEAGANHCAVS